MFDSLLVVQNYCRYERRVVRPGCVRSVPEFLRPGAAANRPTTRPPFWSDPAAAGDPAQGFRERFGASAASRPMI
jgi:hypothetical protein